MFVCRSSPGSKTGKRQRRPITTVGRLSSLYHLENNKKCYYVQDQRNGRQYLVDTGAEFSILPASQEDKKRLVPSEALEAANGTTVPVFGRRNITLDFGRGRVFSHSFLLADVTKPLLCVDFFNTNNIRIDTRGRRMFNLSNCGWLGGEKESSGATICSLDLFGDFPDILSHRSRIKMSVTESNTTSRLRALLSLSLIHI